MSDLAEGAILMSETTMYVDCPCCGGNGAHIISRFEWEDTYLGPCEACGGTGQVEVELQPIEMEDLGQV
jgi:DnaJ-class molecular chaperone